MPAGDGQRAVLAVTSLRRGPQTAGRVAAAGRARDSEARAGQNGPGVGEFTMDARHAAVELLSDLGKRHPEEKSIPHDLGRPRSAAFQLLHMIGEVPLQVGLAGCMGGEIGRMAADLLEGGCP